MPSDRVKALIREYNPWWEGKETAVPEYRRFVFADVQKYMKTRQIVAIIGLRRVGKTVLMQQAIKELLHSAGRENVFYFLFDEIIAQNTEALEDVLDYYLKIVAKEGRKFIFLDEIQKVPYWQDVLKRFYDTKDDIKFVVSGSSSLGIRKSKESLAGRIFDIYAPVLTFREFLGLNGIKIGKTELNFEKLRQVYEENLHKKPVLEQMFLEYIFKGAFPEIAKEGDEGIVKNYIKNSVVENIILGDIPAAFNVRKKDILYSVLEYCSRETSNLLDLSNLAKTLGVNYQTIRSYVFYLQNAFIIDMVYNYSRSASRQLRKSKKVHIAHPSIAMAMMGYPKDALGIGETAGRYAETIVFQHSKIVSDRIYFWRSPQKEEVDILIERGGLLPVEVKYRSETGRRDMAGTMKFMEKHGLKTGIVVTKDLLKKESASGKTILFIPIWLFLMAV